MKKKISVCSLLLFAVLSSCATAQVESSSSDYVVPEEKQILWTDCLKQEETDYLVFLYSDTCANCHEIMGDVLAFSDENIIKVYFSEISKGELKIPISRDVDETLGVTDINYFFIAGTPTIIEIYEGTIIANIPGMDDCLSFLNEQRLNNEN